MKKSKAKLAGLSDDQDAMLETWLFDERPPLSYTAVRERLWLDYQFPTSERALHAWYHKRLPERQLAKIAESRRESGEVHAEFVANPDNSLEALAGLIRQAAFDAQMHGVNLDLATLKDINELLQSGLKSKYDAKILELKERELALKESRYRDMVEEQKRKIEAAVNTAKSKGGLTPETLKQIEEAASLL